MFVDVDFYTVVFDNSRITGWISFKIGNWRFSRSQLKNFSFSLRKFNMADAIYRGLNISTFFDLISLIYLDNKTTDDIFLPRFPPWIVFTVLWFSIIQYGEEINQFSLIWFIICIWWFSGSNNEYLRNHFEFIIYLLKKIYLNFMIVWFVKLLLLSTN